MNELKIFNLNNKIDIMLISKTYLTKKHYFKISSYSIYYTQYTIHLNGRAYDDIAIIIENNI